jgi:parallel beta-helix repeat protein
MLLPSLVRRPVPSHSRRKRGTTRRSVAAAVGIVVLAPMLGAAGPAQGEMSPARVIVTGGGPQGVRCPKKAVSISPGENLAAAIRRHRGGTTFCLEPGVHRPRSMLVPKNGQSFVARRGGDVIVQGPGAPAFPLFDGHNTGRKNVRVRGLIIEGFGNESYPAIRAGSGWVIKRNEIRFNQNGVNLGEGTGPKVLKNYIHDQNGYGIGGWQGRDALVKGNEVAFNPGPQKLVGTVGAIIRNNHYHDNLNGIWLDGGNDDFLIEGNLVEGVQEEGIENESGCSGVIRNNTVRNNGKAGIQITASEGNEVSGNTVENNRDGISIWHQDRRNNDGSGDRCVWWLGDVTVHNNTVTMTQGHTGLMRCCGVPDDSIFNSGTVRFTDNIYYFGPGSNFFYWLNGERTPDEWRGFGNDVNGTFNPLP